MIQRNLRHLANFISATRIFGVAVIFWITPYSTNLWQHLAVHIFILICITDFLDGWIARKLRIVSDLGKILDPLADKILVLIFLPLLEMGAITSFPVFIILAREFAVMALRVVVAKDGGVVVSAQFSGKLKTLITLPVCGILLGRVNVLEVPDLPAVFLPLEWVRQWIMIWPQWIITVLIYTVVLVTIWSFLDHFDNFIWQRYVKHRGGNAEEAKKTLRTLVPNTFSVMNLCFGISAVVFAWLGLFATAALLVILGIICDALDGTLARKFDARSAFGARLDSRADFVSFGIAPAVVIFRLVSNEGSPLWFYAGMTLGFLYYFAIHYRLRRFDQKGHQDYFEGLPSPVGAALVIFAAVSTYLSGNILFCLLVVGVAFLLISRFPYAHFSVAGQGRLMRFLRIPALVFTVLAIMNLLDLPYARHVFAHEILFAITSIYVLSPIGFLFRKKSNG